MKLKDPAHAGAFLLLQYSLCGYEIDLYLHSFKKKVIS
jgi:hypothetical protein